MNNKNTFLGSLLAVAVVVFVYAQAAYSADSSSGCGLGWEVTQKQSLLSSAIRNTTNTFLPNTFSMTSGTSGCAKHSIVKNDEAAVIYALNNHHALMIEMAQGQGQFLSGFAQSLGCDVSLFGEFAKFTQSHYSEIMNSSNSSAQNDGIELYKSVRTEMLNSPVFAQACMPRA